MQLQKKEIAKVLIKAGASTDIEDAFGFTPMSIAEKLGHDDLVELIKSVKASYRGP